jgi:hypothetical protein
VTPLTMAVTAVVADMASDGVGEPQTVVQRINPMRDRRRRVGALDDEHD